MRFATVPPYVALGVSGTILLISALTFQLVGPARAAEVQAGAPQTTTTSHAVTRNGITFDIAIYRPSTQQQRSTVVLLHGFPGGHVGEGFSPRTQSHATSLARSGYSVVRFNYIGSWANGGSFHGLVVYWTPKQFFASSERMRRAASASTVRVSC